MELSAHCQPATNKYGRLNEVAVKNLTLAKFTKLPKELNTDVLRPFLMSHTQINYQLYELEIL